MKYYTGLTKAQADALSMALLTAARSQLGTVASKWGQIQLKDGTWAVKDDARRLPLLTLPATAANRIAAVKTANNFKTREQIGISFPDPVIDPRIPRK